MEVFSLGILPRALGDLIRESPSVLPHNYECIPSRMIELLLHRQVDVGFTVGAQPTLGIELHAIGASSGVLVCGSGHPLFLKRQITPPDLLQFPSVVPRFLGSEHLPTLDPFPDHRWPRRVGATIELLTMGVDLVRTGNFLGFFPTISVERWLEDGSLRSLQGLELPAFTLYAMTRTGEQKPAVLWLLEWFRQHLNPSGGEPVSFIAASPGEAALYERDLLRSRTE